MNAPTPDKGPRPGRPPKAVRWKKIAELRERIRRGAYDEPEKWDRILDRLLKDLRPEGP